MFFMVWSGYGFLAALIPVVTAVAGTAALDAIFGPGWVRSHDAAIALLLFISAGLVWVVGTKLNSKPGRVLIDEQTGEKVEFKQRHTLFWIPMQWISAVIAAIGLVLLFK